MDNPQMEQPNSSESALETSFFPKSEELRM